MRMVELAVVSVVLDGSSVFVLRLLFNKAPHLLVFLWTFIFTAFVSLGPLCVFVGAVKPISALNGGQQLAEGGATRCSVPPSPHREAVASWSGVGEPSALRLRSGPELAPSVSAQR